MRIPAFVYEHPIESLIAGVLLAVGDKHEAQIAADREQDAKFR